MKKKIVGIVICMLLISSTSTLALTPFCRDGQQMKHQLFVDRTPVTLPTSKGWMKTFGGAKGDCGCSVQQTTDGGYIIVGSVNLYESLVFDAWLIKLDSNGNEQWNRTFGQNQSEDFGHSVQQTSDGGYIVAGSTEPYVNNQSYAFWLIKTDGQGNMQWNRTYGEIDFSAGTVSVELTSDGGYIILGTKWYYESRTQDIWIIKTDQYGNEQWNKTYGSIKDEYGSQAYQTSDGGYIILGNRIDWNTSNSDVWMIKVDALGEEQWNRTYGGKYWDGGTLIDLTSDGGYIITGCKAYYVKQNYTTAVWLIKTDSQGKSKTTLSGNL